MTSVFCIRMRGVARVCPPVISCDELPRKETSETGPTYLHYKNYTIKCGRLAWRCCYVGTHSVRILRWAPASPHRESAGPGRQGVREAALAREVRRGRLRCLRERRLHAQGGLCEASRWKRRWQRQRRKPRQGQGRGRGQSQSGSGKQAKAEAVQAKAEAEQAKLEMQR